jgi:hypothetical protein
VTDETEVIDTPPVVFVGTNAGAVESPAFDARKITEQFLAVLNMSGYREIVDRAEPATVEEAFKIFLVARGLREIVSDDLPLPDALALAAKVAGCEAALA